MARILIDRAKFAQSFDFDNRSRNLSSVYASDGYEISLDTDHGLVRIEKNAHAVFTTIYNLVSFEPITKEEASSKKPANKTKGEEA